MEKPDSMGKTSKSSQLFFPKKKGIIFQFVVILYSSLFKDFAFFFLYQALPHLSSQSYA